MRRETAAYVNMGKEKIAHQEKLDTILLQTELSDYLIDIESLAPGFRGGLSHAHGYTICVDGGTPRARGRKANEHGLIHAIYDPAEKKLGSEGAPPGTATLGELELIGVMAAAAITGCNPTIMLAELHAYHISMGLKSNDLYRAYNKTNLLKTTDLTKIGSNTQKGAGGL